MTCSVSLLELFVSCIMYKFGKNHEEPKQNLRRIKTSLKIASEKH